MARRWWAATLALAVLSPVGALAQADAKFFPMKEGARYEYKGRGGIFIVEFLRANERQADVRETLVTGDSVIGDIVGAGVYRLGDDGVTSDLIVASPLGRNEKMSAILRFPLSVGKRWKEIGEDQIEFRVGAVGVTVKVPAGTFTGCVRVDTFLRGKKIEASRWFAPGIGLVRDGMRGDLVKISGVSK